MSDGPPLALTLSGLELANTVNAWHPLLRSGYHSLPFFAAGWATSERPLHAIGLSAARLAYAAARGDLRGPRGAAAVAVAGLSWLGLGAVHARGLRSRAVLERAVLETLGPPRAAVLGPPRAATDRADPDLPPARSSLRRRRRYVGPLGTRAYGDAGRANMLDIWRHPDLASTAKAPVLLQIPGGAWALGSKQGQAYPLLAHMAGQGWVCVSMSYRLSPAHRWPAHLLDVKRALAWVKSNIAEHGGDPNFVAVTGGSAGGHLAALAALTAEDRTLQPGFEDADLRVAAAVPIYGRYDWVSRDGPGRREIMAFLQHVVVNRSLDEAPEVFRAASPLYRVHPSAPPFFVVHGDADSLIPVEEAREFVAALRSTARAPVAYAELPGAQHAFDIFNSPRARHTAHAVQLFLDSIRRGGLVS